MKAKQKAEQRVEMDRLALGRLAIASGAIDNFLATDAVPVFATSLSEIETRLNKDTRLQVDIDKNVVAEKGTVAAMIKSADLDDGKPRKVYEKTDSYRYKGETHGKTYDLNVEAHEYLISGEVRGVRGEVLPDSIIMVERYTDKDGQFVALRRVVDTAGKPLTVETVEKDGHRSRLVIDETKGDAMRVTKEEFDKDGKSDGKTNLNYDKERILKRAEDGEKSHHEDGGPGSDGKDKDKKDMLPVGRLPVGWECAVAEVDGGYVPGSQADAPQSPLPNAGPGVPTRRGRPSLV